MQEDTTYYRDERLWEEDEDETEEQPSVQPQQQQQITVAQAQPVPTEQPIKDTTLGRVGSKISTAASSLYDWTTDQAETTYDYLFKDIAGNVAHGATVGLLPQIGGAMQTSFAIKPSTRRSLITGEPSETGKVSDEEKLKNYEQYPYWEINRILAQPRPNPLRPDIMEPGAKYQFSQQPRPGEGFPVSVPESLKLASQEEVARFDKMAEESPVTAYSARFAGSYFPTKYLFLPAAVATSGVAGRLGFSKLAQLISTTPEFSQIYKTQGLPAALKQIGASSLAQGAAATPAALVTGPTRSLLEGTTPLSQPEQFTKDLLEEAGYAFAGSAGSQALIGSLGTGTSAGRKIIGDQLTKLEQKPGTISQMIKQYKYGRQNPISSTDPSISGARPKVGQDPRTIVNLRPSTFAQDLAKQVGVIVQKAATELSNVRKTIANAYDDAKLARRSRAFPREDAFQDNPYEVYPDATVPKISNKKFKEVPQAIIKADGKLKPGTIGTAEDNILRYFFPEQDIDPELGINAINILNKTISYTVNGKTVKKSLRNLNSREFERAIANESDALKETLRQLKPYQNLKSWRTRFQMHQYAKDAGVPDEYIPGLAPELFELRPSVFNKKGGFVAQTVDKVPTEVKLRKMALDKYFTVKHAQKEDTYFLDSLRDELDNMMYRISNASETVGTSGDQQAFLKRLRNLKDQAEASSENKQINKEVYEKINKVYETVRQAVGESLPDYNKAATNYSQVTAGLAEGATGIKKFSLNQKKMKIPKLIDYFQKMFETYGNKPVSTDTSEVTHKYWEKQLSGALEKQLLSAQKEGKEVLFPGFKLENGLMVPDLKTFTPEDISKIPNISLYAQEYVNKLNVMLKEYAEEFARINKIAPGGLSDQYGTGSLGKAEILDSKPGSASNWVKLAEMMGRLDTRLGNLLSKETLGKSMQTEAPKRLAKPIEYVMEQLKKPKAVNSFLQKASLRLEQNPEYVELVRSFADANKMGNELLKYNALRYLVWKYPEFLGEDFEE